MRVGAYLKQKMTAPSKRTPLLEDQAKHLAQLIEHLAKSACTHFGVRDVSELRCDQHEAFCALPAYDMFVVGAYACGFVMRDALPKNPLEKIDSRPHEAIEQVDLPTLNGRFTWDADGQTYDSLNALTRALYDKHGQEMGTIQATQYWRRESSQISLAEEANQITTVPN